MFKTKKRIRDLEERVDELTRALVAPDMTPACWFNNHERCHDREKCICDCHPNVPELRPSTKPARFSGGITEPMISTSGATQWRGVEAKSLREYADALSKDVDTNKEPDPKNG
jgi:hypothetical protein